MPFEAERTMTDTEKTLDEPAGWNERYAGGETPWDSGQPSRELERIVAEGWFDRCRALELGCGTGTNAVFLASRGFDVTGVDFSPLAIQKAEARARAARAKVRFLVADVTSLPDLGEPFPLVWDRGVYHHMRNVDLEGFLRTLEKHVAPGGWYLTLAGNANDPAPEDPGPPRVDAVSLVNEPGRLFDLVQLREFRFDGVVASGEKLEPLAWSALFRRRPAAGYR
jgi:SAM-dependent methyltransferase